MLDWNTIIVQLGISALIVFVAYKIGMKLIDHWAKNDAQRTVVIGAGFEAIVQRHENTIQVINEHQSNELVVLNDIKTEVKILTTRIDTALDLTPIHGSRGVPIEIPVEDPPPKRAQTEPGKPGRITGAVPTMLHHVAKKPT